MLLERRSRPHRGVRVIRREAAPFGFQVVPTRMLTRDDVERTMQRLPEDSRPVVTSALSSIERAAFIEYGFTEREALHLLRHNFVSRPGSTPAGGVRLRSARRSDTSRILEIDGQSFDEFWRLDRAGLTSARRATPINRYICALVAGRVAGYAITGLSGTTSYLQRLAVEPDQRGAGVGTRLVLDAIEWAIGRGSLAMMVNTQVSNDGALRLYRSLGFELDNEQLMVLEWPRERSESTP